MVRFSVLSAVKMCNCIKEKIVQSKGEVTRKLVNLAFENLLVCLSFQIFLV